MKKTNKVTKAMCQFYHAKHRAKERYNLSLTKEEYNQIVDLIRTNKAETLYRQSIRVSVKKVEYKDQTLYVIYDASRGTIATFLLEEHIDKQAMADYKKSQEQSTKTKSELRSAMSWEAVMGMTKKLQNA